MDGWFDGAGSSAGGGAALGDETGGAGGAGSVGVGTGGGMQSQSEDSGHGDASAGVPASSRVVSSRGCSLLGAGACVAGAGARTMCRRGPMPVFSAGLRVASGAGGANSPAGATATAGSLGTAAGGSAIRSARTVVASRYAPAVPPAASAQNVLIATNRRGGRAATGTGATGDSNSEPGNVFIPVEVTSGSTGRLPARSHRLINGSPLWSGTLYG